MCSKQYWVVRNGAWVVCVIALLGCGKKDDVSSAAGNSQVVARIGDQVVSAQELETELRWNNVGADQKPDDATIRRALGELVARKYLVQQALAAKLDREPTVLLDILRSREQVLARAYASRQLARQVSAISVADTEKYVADHPARFALAKVITAEQITVPMGSVDHHLIDSVKTDPSISSVEQRLTELGAAHSRSSMTFNTSEASDELLRSIEDRKPGDVVFIRSGQNGVFLHITSEQAHPVAGQTALKVARQLQQQELAKAQASLTNFTTAMEAKYEGEYAKIMSENSASANGTN